MGVKKTLGVHVELQLKNRMYNGNCLKLCSNKYPNIYIVTTKKICA